MKRTIKERMEMALKAESDNESLLWFTKLSVRNKLEYIDQLVTFTRGKIPAKNTKIWEKLKQQGF